MDTPFTEEDAEFVVYYSNGNDKVVDQSELENDMGAAAYYFYKGTNSKRFFQQKISGGVTAQFSGLITTHNNSLRVSDQWYSGDTTLRIMAGSSKVKSIKTVIKFIPMDLLEIAVLI